MDQNDKHLTKEFGHFEFAVKNYGVQYMAPDGLSTFPATGLGSSSTKIAFFFRTEIAAISLIMLRF